VKSLLKDPEAFDGMSIYDRDYLMLWIWANNYTTTKEFEVTCPVCDNVDHISVDVTKVDVSELSEEIKVPHPFKLKDGKVINLKLLSVEDEQIANDFVKSNKKESLESVLLALVMDVGKVMPLPQKLRWIEDNICGKDMGLIRGFQDYFKYGVDDKEEHTCEACGEVTQHHIPFSIEFFMPTLRNDFEKLLRANKGSEDKSD